MDPAQAEREALLKVQKERLQKRANLVVNILRKFILEWNSAHLKELEAARAAAAAKAARKGRKGRRKKEKKAPEDSKANNKKKLKKPKRPIVEAWAWLFASLDELMSKQKRITLEDTYRGCELLGPQELVQLRNIIYTANKKVLPTNMNVNQNNMKQALWAAAAAHEYSTVDRRLLAPQPAFALMHAKGLSAQQLHELGYKEAELRRNGFSNSDLCEVSVHTPDRLRTGGLTVADVVAGCGGVQSLPLDLRGFRGIQKLKAAGYSAADMVAGGLDNAWDLAKAGFSAAELYSAGVLPEALRPAGFGLPELRPPGFLGPSLSVLQQSDTCELPHAYEGTRGGIWPRVMQPQLPANEHSRLPFRMSAARGGRPIATSAAAIAPVPSLPPTVLLSPTSTVSGYVMANRPQGIDMPPRVTVAWSAPSLSQQQPAGSTSLSVATQPVPSSRADSLIERGRNSG